MRSMQLRASRHAVHSVGITQDGVLYIDVQRVGKGHHIGPRTFYVRPADVARIKQLATAGRPWPMTDEALVRLMAASFHSAQYALEWLRWAGIATLRSPDAQVCRSDV